MQREPFLTSVWIMTCLSALSVLFFISIAAMDNFGYSETLSEELFDRENWYYFLEESAPWCATPIVLIYGAYRHLKHSVNKISSIIIIMASVALILYDVSLIPFLLEDLSEYNSTIMQHRPLLGNLVVYLGFILAVFSLGLWGLWTGIAMLRYNTNKAIKPELFG